MSILMPEATFKYSFQEFKRLCPQSGIYILILIFFCFFLFILGIGCWDLWNPDEPRYAQVAREMLNGGDWILMHVNGQTYEDKPPLFFWLIVFSSFLWQGFTSFSARFPSGLLSTLTVLLTFQKRGCSASLNMMIMRD